MAGSHHFVHLVMWLSAQAVRTRMNSGASPHHRLVSVTSGHTTISMAHHLFPLRTRENDPVMW